MLEVMDFFLQVVGYEGLLGSIALFAILMPIVQFIPGKDGEGLHEDSLESIHMVRLCWPLLPCMGMKACQVAWQSSHALCVCGD